jgi:hypothetical protein
MSVKTNRSTKLLSREESKRFLNLISVLLSKIQIVLFVGNVLKKKNILQKSKCLFCVFFCLCKNIKILTNSINEIFLKNFKKNLYSLNVSSAEYSSIYNVCVFLIIYLICDNVYRKIYLSENMCIYLKELALNNQHDLLNTFACWLVITE